MRNQGFVKSKQLRKMAEDIYSIRDRNEYLRRSTGYLKTIRNILIFWTVVSLLVPLMYVLFFVVLGLSFII